MDRQRPVKHGTRRRRPFHGPRQPAGERHQRRLARGGHQQQQADEAGPGWASERGTTVGPRVRCPAACRSRLRPAGGASPRRPAAVRHRRRDRSIQTRSPFRAGAGRSWKKATSKADDSPTSSQPANSVSMVPASDGRHHAQHEQRVQDEEAVEAGLAMQVPGREGADRPAAGRTRGSRTAPTAGRRRTSSEK